MKKTGYNNDTVFHQIARNDSVKKYRQFRIIFPLKNLKDL
jgi:hypothetical protein